MAADLYRLCRGSEIGEGESRGFVLETVAGAALEIFLVRKDDRLYGYRNSCPHTGGPLDWVPDRFLDLEGNLIQCATHAALFTIDQGLCIAGPCTGQSLQAVEIRVSGGFVFAAAAKPDQLPGEVDQS